MIKKQSAEFYLKELEQIENRHIPAIQALQPLSSLFKNISENRKLTAEQKEAKLQEIISAPKDGPIQIRTDAQVIKNLWMPIPTPQN